MKEVTFSIIIPVFNGENTIERCIKSIPKTKNIEIIVVIDGCTDKTESICKKMSENDERIKVIVQENSGPFYARKNGILNSNGDYLMFIDSDDMIIKNATERIEFLINKYNTPDAIRFRYKKLPEGYEQYKYFQDDEKYILKNEFKNEVYPMFLNSYQLNSIWGNCVKREVLEKINILPKAKRYAEDLELNLEIFSKIENILFTNDIIYIYNSNNESLTKTSNVDKLLLNLTDAISVYSSLYKYLNIWNMNTNTYKEMTCKKVNKEIDAIVEEIKQKLKNNNYGG